MTLSNIQKRFLLFLIGCIGVRSLFVVIAKKIDSKYLPILGYLALLPVFGWLYILITNSRKIGLETFGDKIWWNDLRYVHTINYAIFAYLAINKNKNAWIVLLIDVIIGLVAFLNHHYKLKSFEKLF